MKYECIREHRDRFEVSMMCRLLSVSRSGFYDWLDRPAPRRVLEDQELLVLIEQVFYEHKRRYGSFRVWKEFKARGVACGRDRIARLMKENGLVALATPKRKPQTTDSAHENKVAPNLLDRKFEVEELDSVWVADLTYIGTKEGWLYLSCVMDLCSRKIVGWSMREDLETKGPLDALEMALANREPKQDAIHHSDRGTQYASNGYQERLEEAGLSCSMSRKGNCWDNAPMESFFGRMKEELDVSVFETRAQASQQVFKYIETYYNRIRRHSGIDYLSPNDFENQRAA